MKVALIGMGMVASTHLAAIEASGIVDLAGVYVRDPAKAGGLHRFGSVQEVADDPTVDFAILLTPPSTRVEMVTTLARAGKPVLMEKPIERSLAGARAVVAACAGISTGVVFQHRFRQDVSRLASMLRAGDLGEVAMAEIIIPWWRPQSYYDEPGRGTFAQDGGGVLITQAIHVLDFVMSLLGPVKAVQAMARTTALHNMETEDFVAAGLEFASGVVASLSATTASFPGGSEVLRIHGSQGSAQLSGGALEVKWRDGSTAEFGDAGGSGGGANPMAFTHAWHQGVIEDFATSLSEGRPARVTAQEALSVHALIEALLASSTQGRRVEVENV